MDAAKRPDGEPGREPRREPGREPLRETGREPGHEPGREADRERAYNGADRRPAQNLDTAYRSRWMVNAASGRRRERRGLPAALVPLDLPPAERLSERLSPAPPAARLPIDLGPLVRLAQEACWGRFFNRPRHSAIVDA